MEQIYGKTIYGTLMAKSESIRLNPFMNPRQTYELQESVDPDRLNTALEAALKCCPYMAYGMERRDGEMAFTPNPLPLRAMRLQDEPRFFDCEEDNHHIVHVLYEKKKIILSVSHALTDACGMLWFSDAFLKKYFGIDAPVYDGYGKADYARDLMGEALPLPADYTYYDPLPDSLFRIPELDAGNCRQTFSVDRSLLKKFCVEKNCSVSMAVFLMLAMAVDRVHPDNGKNLAVRMPVDTRRLLNVPNVFQNASVPQLLMSVRPDRIRGKIEPDVVQELNESYRKQLTYEQMAFVTNYFRLKLTGSTGLDPVTDEKVKKPWRNVSMMINNIGNPVSDVLLNRVKRFSGDSAGEVPLRLSLHGMGGREFIRMDQNFANRCYIDAMKEVLDENGIPTLDEEV